MKPTKQEVARQFGERSRAYLDSPRHAGGADLERLIELLEPRPDMAVLDVATGAGHTAVAVAPRVVSVVAGDLAPEMLERTRELARSRGVTNVRPVVMDVELLPFSAGAFDAVTCRIAPHHFLDPGQAVREVARVLKPGGRFLLEDNTSPDDPALARFLDEVERVRDPTHVRSYTEREWRAMLAAAGLEPERAEFFRKPQNVAEWLDRAGRDEAARPPVYRVLAAASEAARRHFDLRYDGDRATWITDEKVLIRAFKG